MPSPVSRAGSIGRRAGCPRGYRGAVAAGDRGPQHYRPMAGSCGGQAPVEAVGSVVVVDSRSDGLDIPGAAADADLVAVGLVAPAVLDRRPVVAVLPHGAGRRSGTVPRTRPI